MTYAAVQLRLAAMCLVALVLWSRAAAAQAPSAEPTAPPSAAPSVPGGVIPPTLTLEVTGSPAADPAFLYGQIRAALDRAIRPTLRPGTAVTYGPVVPWPLFALRTGERAAVNVNVTISGDSSLAATAVSGMTTVLLYSVAVAPQPPSVLFLSDDPEYLPSEGLVFRGEVTPERPTRLYYYHSDVGVPRDLDVVLTARSPVRVHLIASEAGPELDVLDVGHTVTRDSLVYQRSGEGIVATIVPGRPFVVRHALVLQGEVVAGAVDLAIAGSGAVTVSVVASAAGSPPDAYLGGPRVPFDGHRRHGTFDLAGYGALAATYTVGGAPATVQYGARTPTPRNLDPGDDGHDYGDYGVVHRITLTLVNPTDESRPVYLYERALGGPVRSTFVIDGAMREVGCVRLSQPYWLATYQLAPHTTGASTTITMTDGGSYYPLEFGATETQPAAFIPPVGSPDGCSPIAPPFHEASAR